MSEKLSLSIPLSTLVARNSFFASALHRTGINYPNYPTASLVEACHESGISVFVALNKLQSIERDYKHFAELETYPLDLVIGYLRYIHRLIIRERLPYVQSLADMIQPSEFSNKELAHDLKLIIPVYVEDFVKHIHQEEDTFFNYALAIYHALNNKNHSSSTLYKYRKYSMLQFAHDHAHEDETDGIRLITEDYTVLEEAAPLEKIVIQELKAFDKEMELHSRIENELVIPKAIALEKALKKHGRILSSLN